MPMLSCPIELRTDAGRRVFHRVWDRLKADLYVITVRSRTVGMEEAARTMEAMISQEFEAVRHDLETEMAAADSLRETIKSSARTDYPNPLKQDAQYSTPRAYEYLMLILQMDALLQVNDFLWLSGLVDTHTKVQRAQNWQRRLTKVANRMRELGNRTRSAATREIERRMQKSGRGPADDDEPATGSEALSGDAAGGASAGDDDHEPLDTTHMPDEPADELGGGAELGTLDDDTGIAEALVREIREATASASNADESPQD